MRNLITYILEKFGKSNRIELDDPIMDETVNGMKRRAIVLALWEGRQK